MRVEVENGESGSVKLHFINEANEYSTITAHPQALRAMLDAGWQAIMGQSSVNTSFQVDLERVVVPATVFPSDEPTIVSIVTEKKFKGAHNYEVKPMLRYQQRYSYDLPAIEKLFSDEGKFLSMQSLIEVHSGVSPGTDAANEIIAKAVKMGYIQPVGAGGAVYGQEGMPIVFVKQNADGTWQPGLQTEQLLLVVADRHVKMNDVYPSDVHDEFMGHIQGALECLGRRVRERQARGVMGTQQK